MGLKGEAGDTGDIYKELIAFIKRNQRRHDKTKVLPVIQQADRAALYKAPGIRSNKRHLFVVILYLKSNLR